MTQPVNFPGPGDETLSDRCLEAEAAPGPMPAGEMPPAESLSNRRAPGEYVDNLSLHDGAWSIGGRSGTESGHQHARRAPRDEPEDRQDRRAADGQRETEHDPVPDEHSGLESGPPSVL